MGYKSVNEIEQFSFDDCQITRLSVLENEIVIEVCALIVKRNNSQNTNYTDSYAGATRISLKNAELCRVIKDGYKYYNADEVLIKEIPDEVIDEKDYNELFEKCENAYLYSMELEKKEEKYYYALGIEFVDEENMPADSYRLMVSFSDAVFEWDRYMNRVQS